MAAPFLGIALVLAALQGPAATSTPAPVDSPVLSRSVAKGEILGAPDFTTAPLPATAARTALSPSEAAGHEALRPLRAGQPVRTGDIAAPRVIRRGQAVTILFTSGSLQISAAGRALSDAAAGEPVRVINLSSNRTLDAVADAQGRARLTATQSENSL
jgi:flagella basal body P-ring formation protein FlgA